MLCNNIKEREAAEDAGAACILYQNKDYPPFAEAPKQVPLVWLTPKVAEDIGDYLRYIY